MRFIYKICCSLGFHDWFVHKKKQRLDLNPNSNGWILLLYAATGVSLFVLLFITLFTFLPAEGHTETLPVKYLFTNLGLISLLGFITLFIHKNEFRKDARCLNCGEQKLELSKRESAKENAAKFFKNYDSMEN